VGTRQGLPLLADGRVLDVANVIWCTGFDPGSAWIHLPVFGEDGVPKHESGVATGEPGLYFVGLPFIYSFSSTMIHGVGRDAERIAQFISAGQPLRRTKDENNAMLMAGNVPPSSP
jgi:putative flavoprotein involved in K+ transport